MLKGFPPADFVTKSVPGPICIPGEARYVGVVNDAGYVCNISEEL